MYLVCRLLLEKKKNMLDQIIRYARSSAFVPTGAMEPQNPRLLSSAVGYSLALSCVYVFNAIFCAPTDRAELFSLSLHDALPISTHSYPVCEATRRTTRAAYI